MKLFKTKCKDTVNASMYGCIRMLFVSCIVKEWRTESISIKYLKEKYLDLLDQFISVTELEIDST